MQKIHADEFRVRAGKKIDLSKWPTRVKPVYSSKEEYKALLAEHIEKLSARQPTAISKANGAWAGLTFARRAGQWGRNARQRIRFSCVLRPASRA